MILAAVAGLALAGLAALAIAFETRAVLSGIADVKDGDGVKNLQVLDDTVSRLRTLFSSGLCWTCYPGGAFHGSFPIRCPGRM